VNKAQHLAGEMCKPRQCHPKNNKILKLQIRSERVGAEIQYMKDHTLIGKFIGTCTTEKTLIWWINITWKPQGHYDLQLGAEGFFTVILFNEADRTRIFEGGPYFFNSTGLYLKPWKERFSLKKENMTIALVWIRLYLLPSEYWKEEILIDLGNTLGVFVKVSEKTKKMRYTSYARICIYMDMDISQDLPEGIELTWEDEDWF